MILKNLLQDGQTSRHCIPAIWTLYKLYWEGSEINTSTITNNIFYLGVINLFYFSCLAITIITLLLLLFLLLLLLLLSLLFFILFFVVSLVFIIISIFNYFCCFLLIFSLFDFHFHFFFFYSFIYYYHYTYAVHRCHPNQRNPVRKACQILPHKGKLLRFLGFKRDLFVR